MLFADVNTLKDIMTYHGGVCCFIVPSSEQKQFTSDEFSSGRITIRDPETYKDYGFLYKVVGFPRVSSGIAKKRERCVMLELKLDTKQPDIEKCHSVFTKKQMSDMGWIIPNVVDVL